MAIWPFCPRPVFSESLRWSSGVIATYAAEQRQRFTDAPRQGLSLGHVMSFRQFELAKLLVELTAQNAWQVPLWYERQRVTVSAGASSIPVDTTASDYRAGGYAFLWRSDEQCEAVLIDAVNAGSLTLDGSALYGYDNGYCMPLRNGYATGGVTANRSVQKLISVDIDLEMFDTLDLADAGLYPTYRGHSVITDPPRIGSGSIDENLFREVEIVDNGLAVPYYSLVSNRITRPLDVAWITKSLPELWALRQFLHSRYGKQKGSWIPDWTRGYQLTRDIASSDTSIHIRSIGLPAAQQAGDLMIALGSGAQHRFRFTGAAVSGGDDVLTLSGAAGANISMSTVRTVCQMRFCRFAADRIEIEHTHTGRGQVSRIQIACEQVPIP